MADAGKVARRARPGHLSRKGATAYDRAAPGPGPRGHTAGRLHQLEGALARTRDGVDAIASEAERLRAGVEALGELRQRVDTSVGIEMFVDAAVVCSRPSQGARGVLDVQARWTRWRGMADDHGRDA